MKKGGFSFKNLYRVFITRPGKSAWVIGVSQETPQADRNLDAFLRKTIQEDRLTFETGNEIIGILEERVFRKGTPSLSKNSLAGAFLPIFSLQHIELKMAAITLALVITLGTGPAGIHSVNRNLSPSFLADTLIDSSGLIYSQQHDTIFPRQ